MILNVGHDYPVLTPEEAGKVLRLGRSSVYAGIAKGEIPSIRVGHKLLVPRAALEKLLEAKATVNEE